MMRLPPSPPSAQPTDRSSPRHRSPTDRLLAALGVEPSFADGVLGDLAEEYAIRAAADGVASARGWYVRQLVRSMPHLVGSAVRHGSAQQRARLAACGTLVIAGLALTVIALLARDGPPERLVAAHSAGVLIINNVQPVQLPVRVLDAAGHELPSDSVQFVWEGGARLTVSSAGIVSCNERGDATVRAAIGAISTLLDVRCRPVHAIEASTWITLVAGEPARRLPFKAVGIDGRPVLQLRGELYVEDSSVATLDGSSVRARAVGQTVLVVQVGDRNARIRVLVHEPVRTLVGLRADQRLVAVPVRLARGDTVRWELPHGAYWLKYVPRRAGEAPPTITTDGPGGCTPGDGLRAYLLPPDEHGTYCITYPSAAGVTLGHGNVGAPVVEGWLALERVAP